MNAAVLLADYERAMLAATPAGRDGGLVLLLGEGVETLEAPTPNVRLVRENRGRPSYVVTGPLTSLSPYGRMRMIVFRCVARSG